MSFTGVCLLVSNRVVVINAYGFSLVVYSQAEKSNYVASMPCVIALSHLANASLYHLLSYEIIGVCGVVPVSLLVFKAGCNLGEMGAINSNIGSNRAVFHSIELLIPSASWQEREASEMFGVTYSGKRDLRALFTSALNKLNPLCKTTPTAGFYELSRVGGSLVACRLEVS